MLANCARLLAVATMPTIDPRHYDAEQAELTVLQWAMSAYIANIREQKGPGAA